MLPGFDQTPLLLASVTSAHRIANTSPRRAPVNSNRPMIAVNCRSGVSANAVISRFNSLPLRYLFLLLPGLRSTPFAGLLLSGRIFHLIAIEKIRDSKAMQRLA